MPSESTEIEQEIEKAWTNPPRPITDRRLLKEQAILGLVDAYYLGMEIIGLTRDEFPAPEHEVKPMYLWLDKPRPQHLSPKQKWLRFWASPRFTRKTYGIAVWLTQAIIREPNVRIIIDGQERQSAGDTVMLIREWLELPEVIRLYGEFKSDFWGKLEFTVAQRDQARRDPTMRALGLDNSEQGKRCDIRWWDDLIGKSNNNPEGIKKVEQHISAGMPIIKPGGLGIYSCTRWNVLDPSTDGFTASGRMGILRHFQTDQLWDAPSPRGWFGAYAQSGDELFYPHAKIGELLYPSVLDESVLSRERQSMTHGEFSSQYLNMPLAEADRQFMPEDLQYFEPTIEGQRNPELIGAIPYLAVDPASAKPKTASKDDSTFCLGYVKWHDQRPHVYIVEWFGGRWPTERIYSTIISLCRDYRPRQIFLEANTGASYFTDALTRMARDQGINLPLAPFEQSLHGTGKKDQRITFILAPLYRNRQVWHATSLKNTKAEMQLVNWTEGGAAHDDYPDVLTTLVMMATKRRASPAELMKAGRKPRGLTAPNQYGSTGM